MALVGVLDLLLLQADEPLQSQAPVLGHGGVQVLAGRREREGWTSLCFSLYSRNRGDTAAESTPLTALSLSAGLQEQLLEQFSVDLNVCKG